MGEVKGRRTALALAAAAALAWAALRPGRNTAPPPVPLAVAPAAEPAEAPAASLPAAPKPIVKKPPTHVVKQPERGAGLREPGEAFGGIAPERVERSTPSAR